MVQMRQARPIALQGAQGLDPIADRDDRDLARIAPYVLCPCGRARRPFGHEQAPIFGGDSAELFAQRFHEAFGGKIGGYLRHFRAGL